MSMKSVILYIKFTIFESILNNYYSTSPRTLDSICTFTSLYCKQYFLILKIYHFMLFKLVYILSILYYFILEICITNILIHILGIVNLIMLN